MRRFIVAPSMARLIRREKGSTAVIEGYFPTQSVRNSHVVIDGAEAFLVLTTADGTNAVEETTAVPARQAEALLDVCAGRIDIQRTTLNLGDRDCTIERITRDGRSIDVALVDAGDDFVPAAWLGREFGGDAAYWNRAFALEGVPSIDVPVSDSAFNALIDVLDGSSVETSTSGVKIIRGAQPLAVAAQSSAEPAVAAAADLGGELLGDLNPATVLTPANPNLRTPQSDRVVAGLSSILARMPKQPANGALPGKMQ